jgi:hypothetical protein
MLTPNLGNRFQANITTVSAANHNFCYPPVIKRTKGESMNLEPITKEIRQQIAKLNHALQVLKGVKQTKQAGPRRKISAAGRKRISMAQKARWRKIRAGKK